MSAQQQPVKVTLQSQRAGDSAKHNDRTMYRNGYFNELAPQDGLTNYHWSQETMGIGSEAREREVYEALFSEKVVQINESRKKHYRKDVYDLENPRQREAALEEYRWKHPPRETIFQIGSMDNPIDRAQAKEILLHQGKRLEQMDSEHFVLLSYDIHMDEGSPHMHARYLMLDERGEVNAEGGLRALGVEPPVSYDKWAKEQNEKRAKRAEKNGKQYQTVKPKSSTNNNRLMTFTKNMRESFEELVEEYGISIDTHRTRKKHLTQRAEKSARARESAEAELGSRIAEYERDDEAARLAVEKQLEELEELKAEQKEERQSVIDQARAEVESGGKEIARLDRQLRKLRRLRKSDEKKRQRLIDNEESAIKWTEGSIRRLEREADQGEKYVELAQKYQKTREKADEVFAKVGRTLEETDGMGLYKYKGEILNEAWFDEKFDQVDALTTTSDKRKDELVSSIKEVQEKLRLAAEADKELQENPFYKEDEVYKHMLKDTFNETESAKQAADNQWSKYHHEFDDNKDLHSTKKWVPPTQQNEEEEEEEKKKDGQLGE